MNDLRKRALERKIGYERRDPVSHRDYSRETALNRFKKTGKFAYIKNGMGHKAGFEWARKVGIDPKDKETKYSANSPSFDEGVHMYKHSAMKHALEKKKQ